MYTDYMHPTSASDYSLHPRHPSWPSFLELPRYCLRSLYSLGPLIAVKGCSPDQLTPYASWETQPNPTAPQEVLQDWLNDSVPYPGGAPLQCCRTELRLWHGVRFALNEVHALLRAHRLCIHGGPESPSELATRASPKCWQDKGGVGALGVWDCSVALPSSELLSSG